MLVIPSLCVPFNNYQCTNNQHLVFQTLVVQTQTAKSKMVQDRVNVCLSTTVIRTMDVAQNAFLAQIARPTKLACKPNVKIHALEAVVKMRNA